MLYTARGAASASIFSGLALRLRDLSTVPSPPCHADPDDADIIAARPGTTEID